MMFSNKNTSLKRFADCSKRAVDRVYYLEDDKGDENFAQICCPGFVEKYPEENTGESLPKFICVKCNGDYCDMSKRLAGYRAESIDNAINNSKKESVSGIKKNENTIICPKMEAIKCNDGVIFPSEVDEKGCGKSQICVKRLSNGKEKDIKVMPYQASQKAIEKLGDLGWMIKLKIVGQKESEKYVYVAEGEKEKKFLGLFGVKVKVMAEIDSFSGQVIKIKKPWWNFLIW